MYCSLYLHTQLVSVQNSFGTLLQLNQGKGYEPLQYVSVDNITLCRDRHISRELKVERVRCSLTTIMTGLHPSTQLGHLSQSATLPKH